jgi:hypothetical protein
VVLIWEPVKLEPPVGAGQIAAARDFVLQLHAVPDEQNHVPTAVAATLAGSGGRAAVVAAGRAGRFATVGHAADGFIE